MHPSFQYIVSEHYMGLNSGCNLLKVQKIAFYSSNLETVLIYYYNFLRLHVFPY